MKIAVLSVLLSLASANSIAGMYGAINTEITVDIANQFKDIFLRFEDCVTPALSAIVKKITPDDIKALVDLHNKIIKNEIPVPQSRTEGLALFKSVLPNLYSDFEAANTDFEKRLAKLTKDDQDKIVQMESGYFNVLKTRTQEGLVDYYLGICTNYQSLSAAQHDDFQAAFPETVKCLDEDLYKQMCSAAQQLKDHNYKMDTKIMSLIGQIFQNKRFAKQN